MDKLSTNHHWTIVFFILLASCLVGCSEKNEDAPYANQVHARSWTDPNLMGSAVFHGTEVVRTGDVACVKCHDLDGRAGAFVPGCFTCHFGPDGSRSPEGSNWIHGRDSHEVYTADREVCNACHDVGRDYNAGPGICHNCHGSGEEHILGRLWLDRDSDQFHGDQPQDDCGICHNLSTNCNECHFGPTGRKSPPGSGWSHGTIDNHNDQENYAGVCNRCHVLSRSYRGEPDSSCHDCHDDD